MIAEIQTRKCLICGHVFIFAPGGFKPVFFPKCPKCGSHFTKAVKNKGAL